ncbi:MAG: arsenic resistance protein [Bacillota bacterium]|jgi:ACR3 family arsenite efflux pump ArsB|uniref:Arsenic resistance protein n=1 Tax=Cytobacillus oceanisediminis 2691 TaxID=1196031 RepID=A0A160MHG0_9BACI|nr:MULTISPECIES: bile acid:sodium symporter [Bacillaceae]AND42889.1 arsenic resistance protein [Cytobacillus oceanisediminis 2691]MBN8202685.1 arsenic resistance protein [Bacillus sp. NTK034]MCM3244748.1 arsenic resistance protein [Cytobacillus oceanisediminis]UQX56962.1 arsenic resistance protein [Cytobacillus pseudoceanisediminis]USK47409.1 arsenic resistance protein [Cytobacillus oceanisediminis]
MISREQLENNQVWLYVIVLMIAAGFGLIVPDFGSQLDATISLVIAILMYSMFSQIPFTSLKESFANRRFIWALLTVNYIAVPIVVWLLSKLLPEYPPLLLGVYLVLLTPCIDYVIVFTALGRGNEKLILISTPILFITQMLLLPLYLLLFIGDDAAEIVNPGPFLESFFGLIVIPLGLAIVLQIYAKKSLVGNKIIDKSAWLPVPFMALTLFVVVSSQIGKLSTYIDLIISVIPIYIAFMIIMPIISRIIAKWFKLDIGSGRALIFSGTTRNSLVVLPLALALPDNLSTLVAAIIVTQTIVELAGELIYIRLVPNILLRKGSP